MSITTEKSPAVLYLSGRQMLPEGGGGRRCQSLGSLCPFSLVSTFLFISSLPHFNHPLFCLLPSFPPIPHSISSLSLLSISLAYISHFSIHSSLFLFLDISISQDLPFAHSWSDQYLLLASPLCPFSPLSFISLHLSLWLLWLSFPTNLLSSMISFHKA